jgi:hypothetical protein
MSSKESVFFITAFDDSWLERKRAFTGKRPGHPFIEPVTDRDDCEGKVRIARIRDDGVKLYYNGPNIGSWFRAGGNIMEREKAEKRLEMLEWAAGPYGYYGHTHDRCFMMQDTLEQAVNSVINNSGDMHEFLYTWIVIQECGPNVDGFENDGQTWFKWEYSSASEHAPYGGHWVRADRPEETKHILAFTPVG